MVISIHVPKCAGTSFRRVLQGRYGAGLWANYGEIFSRAQARPERVPAGTICIHGHFFADAFADLYPEASLITWVRHPVERVLSNYYFFLRYPEIADGCCQALHRNKLSLRQFADLEWMRDETSRYLAGKPPSAFAFVGVTERYAASLALFHSRFGGSSSASAPHDNVNPDRTTENYAVSRSDYGYILERNLADLRWYQEALLPLARIPEAGPVETESAGANFHRRRPAWQAAPA